jgi:hypothetical protein
VSGCGAEGQVSLAPIKKVNDNRNQVYSEEFGMPVGGLRHQKNPAAFTTDALSWFVCCRAGWRVLCGLRRAGYMLCGRTRSSPCGRRCGLGVVLALGAWLVRSGCMVCRRRWVVGLCGVSGVGCPIRLWWFRQAFWFWPMAWLRRYLVYRCPATLRHPRH